jgi:deoxyribonuclease V
MLTPRQAIAVQKELASSVIVAGGPKKVRLVAGLDAAFTVDKKHCIGGVVVWDRNNGRLIEQHTSLRELQFPYIPGLLSFREAPALTSAMRKLKVMPDLLLCDGQGIAHPRRLGIASHIGLITGLPAVGCAKSRLIGDYQEPGPHKGDESPLFDRDELIGAVLRTRDNVRPLFVSVGHKIGLEMAVQIVLSCAVRFRLPEPTRLADILVADRKREISSTASQ